jgi:hypothetical protein
MPPGAVHYRLVDRHRDVHFKEFCRVFDSDRRWQLLTPDSEVFEWDDESVL